MNWNFLGEGQKLTHLTPMSAVLSLGVLHVTDVSGCWCLPIDAGHEQRWQEIAAVALVTAPVPLLPMFSERLDPILPKMKRRA